MGKVFAPVSPPSSTVSISSYRTLTDEVRLSLIEMELNRLSSEVKSMHTRVSTVPFDNDLFFYNISNLAHVSLMSNALSSLQHHAVIITTEV